MTRDPGHPGSLEHHTPVRRHVLGQGEENVQGVELRLVGQTHRTRRREGEAGVVEELHRQSRRACGLELGDDVVTPLGRGGVRDRGAPLHGHVVVRAPAQQPLLALHVRRDVASDGARRVTARDAGELRALQEGDLRRRVAGGARPHVPGLENGHAGAAPGQEQRRRQAGDAGAHDDDVERTAPFHRRVAGQWAGEPE